MSAVSGPLFQKGYQGQSSVEWTGEVLSREEVIRRAQARDEGSDFLSACMDLAFSECRPVRVSPSAFIRAVWLVPTKPETKEATNG